MNFKIAANKRNAFLHSIDPQKKRGQDNACQRTKHRIPRL